jgi:hypothetical protein
MKTVTATTLLASAALLLGVVPAAQAHVTFVDNTAEAGRSFVASANISHGCEAGADQFDTYKVVVELPAGVTARPVHSTLGNARVVGTTLVWERPAPPVATLADDTLFYRVDFRFTVPNLPFTKLTFRTTQTCTNGGTQVWEGVDVPTLLVVPVHVNGWNKYTAQSALDATAISTFFSDAQIVWSNGKAFSANPVTAAVISNPLTSIAAGDVFWVKY